MVKRRVFFILALGVLLAASAAAQSAPSPAGENWGTELVDWTNNMITSYGGLFLSDGMTILAWLAAAKILWTLFLWGNDRALSFSHHAHYPFPMPQLVLLFIRLGVLVFLLNHYMTNLPFVGFSFHSFPMAVSKHIVLELDNGLSSPSALLMQYLQTPSMLVSAPGNPLAIFDGLVYFAVNAWCGLLSFGMFVLGGLGFVLSGVFSVIGPLLIPLWMLGGRIGGYAWNWLQVMMAVGSYRALGAILEYMMSRMWLDFIQNTLAGDTSIANWTAHGSICLGLTCFFLLGMTILPLIAAQIFNGAGAVAQAATGAVTSVVTTAGKVAMAA